MFCLGLPLYKSIIARAMQSFEGFLDPSYFAYKFFGFIAILLLGLIFYQILA